MRTIQLSDTSNSVDRAITMLPELVDKVTELVKSKGGKGEAAAQPQPEPPAAQ